MNGLFYYLLRAPTAAGRAVMDEIEGLELYIRTAETNRLNLAGAPDLNATQFERILPYAVALNAEKPWSEAFCAAFARANPGEDMASGYRPGWHGGSGWSGAGFAHSISSAVSSAESSFAELRSRHRHPLRPASPAAAARVAAAAVAAEAAGRAARGPEALRRRRRDRPSGAAAGHCAGP